MAIIDIDRPTPRQFLALRPLIKAGKDIDAEFVRRNHIPTDALFTFLGNQCRVRNNGRTEVFWMFSRQAYTDDGAFESARISPEGRNYLNNLRDEHF